MIVKSNEQNAAYIVNISIRFFHCVQTEGTSAAIQMKVETSLERRMWASRMTKQVMEMNNHLQSRLLDMMRIRLFGPARINSSSKKRKDERDRVARTR